MKHFYRVNIYETQGILYLILGVLLTTFTEHELLGALSVSYGIGTILSAIFLAIKHVEEIRDYLE